MFDPLSNFKLNKILSAVNALPTTLASSFTEVKNAIAGVQTTTNTIDGKVDIINTNVGNLVNEPFYGRDKVITKDSALNFRYVKKKFTTTAYTSLVDVSGSGIIALVAYYFNGTNSRVTQLRITIDDVEFVMDADAADVSTSRYILASKDDFLTYDNVNAIYTKTGFVLPTESETGFIHPDGSGYVQNRPFTELTESLLTSGDTASSGNTFYAYDGYLKFNKNFKVQVSVSSSGVSAYGFALYSLL